MTARRLRAPARVGVAHPRRNGKQALAARIRALDGVARWTRYASSLGGLLFGIGLAHMVVVGGWPAVVLLGAGAALVAAAAIGESDSVQAWRFERRRLRAIREYSAGGGWS